MRAKAVQCYCIGLLIVPYEEKISLYMTFKTALVFAGQLMQPIFVGQAQFIAQHIEDYSKSLKLFGLVEYAF